MLTELSCAPVPVGCARGQEVSLDIRHVEDILTTKMWWGEEGKCPSDGVFRKRLSMQAIDGQRWKFNLPGCSPSESCLGSGASSPPDAQAWAKLAVFWVLWWRLFYSYSNGLLMVVLQWQVIIGVFNKAFGTALETLKPVVGKVRLQVNTLEAWCISKVRQARCFFFVTTPNLLALLENSKVSSFFSL